ncbi:hypothetical protein Taro_018360 [Colocasia esculenta]|uniref:Sugar phosphate transporter domain-containing protein n=1 Tax=Colocasia esculenta TaxID=4460 RepID=A0A843UTM0_COLES|nr:hypothetical protein [Colocasia esculenta]
MEKKMATASKADRKAALDVASWLFNVVTSVGIIMVNKALMATYGFSFGFYQYVHFLQRRYSLGSFNLLGHTAPVQAASLLLLGPFVDYWLTNKRVDAYDYNVTVVFFIVLSCTIAVGTNLSQFICIGRFTAVSFQVLGHMKTILVLVLGFMFFGKEGLNLHVVMGMILAVAGMIWYGNASSKPGGKERRSYSMPSDKSQKDGALSDGGEVDDKV